MAPAPGPHNRTLWRAPGPHGGSAKRSRCQVNILKSSLTPRDEIRATRSTFSTIYQVDIFSWTFPSTISG